MRRSSMGWFSATWLAAASAALVLIAAGDALAVARDGDLDASFGTRGKVALLFPGNLSLSALGRVDLALLPDGKLLVAATVNNPAGDEDFAVIRLHANGSLDTGFGNNGGRRIGFDRAGGQRGDVLNGMAVQSDGRIVLIGTVDGDSGTDTDFGIVRLTAGGQLDTSFGNDGKAVVPFNLGAEGSRRDSAMGVSLQPDGRIVVAGNASGAISSVMAITRLTTSGQRDGSFNLDGRVMYELGDGVHSAFSSQPLVLADGRIVVVGAALMMPPDVSHFGLLRLLGNGDLDMTFGDAGRVTLPFQVAADSYASAIDVIELSQGRVLACGFARVDLPTNVDMACARFLEDGTVDAAFPPMLVPFDRGGHLVDVAARVRRDGRGRILLAGMVDRAVNNRDFGVARLLPSGDLDTRFGQGGLRTHNSCMSQVCLPATETDNLATSMVVQPDDRIVLAGIVASSGGNGLFQIMRVHGDVLFSDDFQSN